MIVEEWSLTLKSLLNHRTDKILQGVEGSEGLSSLARLKSIITIMCTNDSILPFANDNPVWNKVELVAEMLLDIFADPFHFDVAKWVDAGLLVPSSEDIFKDYDLDGEAEANWELEEMLE
ncbi:hypothetical protein JAAARDRAFT_37658 [Jaapia argillacea MUCL 33604]|uniref:Uncharacterized protein n=1 Tax=Jaapia argillacea MUCL 33604 TaxID=933084 RepID=A0A067PV35_9AGAM|nr:hypothetical protein JAAARDRAFT_37658 [Jaapia argillacea MUCL 33604]